MIEEEHSVDVSIEETRAGVKRQHYYSTVQVRPGMRCTKYSY